MGDSRGSDERLPWLETAPAGAAPAATAVRRARTPLLLLLALLAAGFIAVLAFLAGRTSAPEDPRPSRPASVTARLPAAAPPPPVTAVTPPPAASPVVTAPAAPPPRITARKDRPVARRARRSDRRNPIPRITRAFPLSPVATATPRRSTAAPAPPSARPRGDVVQLGAYVTMPLANAAWARLAGAYPYLSTLPRSITVTPPSPGRPLYYRLRVAAGSRAQARALCNHLHRIGRGCMMVATAK